MKNTGITSHVRKWHRTSPCPYCGARKPRFERRGRIIGAVKLTYWTAECHGCQNAVLITTRDDTIKTAIRKWNQYANGQWRKH